MSKIADFIESGMRCVVYENDRMKHLCGYVGVPTGHPFHGKDYDQCHVVGVHGGWTYASDRAPKEGEDGAWYLGFDCAHAGDMIPSFGHISEGDVYRDEAYVTAELKRAAAELAAISKAEGQ